MTAEKTDAIVLRVTEFSETSCVVTFFTRDCGKVTGLAKGARRRKSPFESALDVLSVVRLMFLRKSGDGLDLLTEARLERRFRSAATDLGRYYAALYLAEMLNVFTEVHDSHPELYDLAVATLSRLDSSIGVPGVDLLWFELQMLSVLGHEPRLDVCCSCMNALPIQKRYQFGLLSGGLLCDKCRAGQRQVVILSDRTVDMARALQSKPMDSLPQLQRQEYSQLRGAINQFESALLGFRPRTQVWLKSVPGTV